MNRILIAIILALGVVLSLSLASCGSSGRYVAVDGDTLKAPNGERIRLLYVDAPELPGHCRPGRHCVPGDPYAARDALQTALDTAPVSCIGERRDVYGRRLAECFLISPSGTRVSINAWLLTTGTVQPYRGRP